MCFINSCSSKTSAAITQPNGRCDRSALLKISLVVLGLLLITGGLALFFSQVNTIASGVIGGFGGFLFLGTLLVSLVQHCSRRGVEKKEIDELGEEEENPPLETATPLPDQTSKIENQNLKIENQNLTALKEEKKDEVEFNLSPQELLNWARHNATVNFSVEDKKTLKLIFEEFDALIQDPENKVNTPLQYIRFSQVFNENWKPIPHIFEVSLRQHYQPNYGTSHFQPARGILLTPTQGEKIPMLSCENPYIMLQLFRGYLFKFHSSKIIGTSTGRGHEGFYLYFNGAESNPLDQIVSSAGYGVPASVTTPTGETRMLGSI